MKTTILQKCLDELNKVDCRKDYVIGILETLIETESKFSYSFNSGTVNPDGTFTPKVSKPEQVTVTYKDPKSFSSDEEQLPPGYATGPIGRIG